MNLAVLCEDIVNGMIAANEFRGAGSDDAFFPITKERLSRSPNQGQHKHDSPLKVIVDIEPRNWDFKLQAGLSSSRQLLLRWLTLFRGSPTSGHEHFWKCAEVYTVRVHHGAVASPGASQRQHHEAWRNSFSTYQSLWKGDVFRMYRTEIIPFICAGSQLCSWCWPWPFNCVNCCLAHLTGRS